MITFETALGTCGMRWNEIGITEVLMPRSRALSGAPANDRSGVPEAVREAIDGIVASLDGERRDLRSVVVDERSVDEFRRSVYAATRQIEAGSTASYGEIARAVGAPDAGPRGRRRAWGEPVSDRRAVPPSARGKQAPCTAFSAPGGIETKRRMLEIERAPGFRQQTLFV